MSREPEWIVKDGPKWGGRHCRVNKNNLSANTENSEVTVSLI